MSLPSAQTPAPQPQLLTDHPLRSSCHPPLSKTTTYPHLICSVEQCDEPEERFIRVLQFFLAGWHLKAKGVKKPCVLWSNPPSRYNVSCKLALLFTHRYNPVLGEFFRCRYDYPNGTQEFYIAEQGAISFPPVLVRQKPCTVSPSSPNLFIYFWQFRTIHLYPRIITSRPRTRSVSSESSDQSPGSSARRLRHTGKSFWGWHHGLDRHQGSVLPHGRLTMSLFAT